MSSRDAELNSATCRLLLNMAPGLDTAAVFQEKVRRQGCQGSWAGLEGPETLTAVCSLLTGRPGGEAL